MNKEKYFVPEESDLRLGYEYETNFNVENKWKKKIINDLGCESDGCGELQDLLTLIYYNNSDLLNYQLNYANRVRVPFLTKEQIKAEGWKEIFNRHDGFGKYSYFQKGTTHITFQEKEHLIEIHNDEDYDEHKTWYNGKCRCINEFRTICKLLEI